MDREKQIEEMANILWHIPDNYSLNCYNDCERMAEAICEAGYRKQSEGEWVYNRGQAPNEPSYFCSLCGDGGSEYGMDNFCPNCGAKMKGGEG